MQTYKKSILLSSALTLLIVPVSHAYSYSSLSVASVLTKDELKANYDQRNTTADKGDAPARYEESNPATHTSAEWNFLGKKNRTDDGVFWSTDNGATWGNGTVHVGDTIMFQITLWSSGYGQHTYDQVKAWVDWDKSGTWKNDNEKAYDDVLYTANETILAAAYTKEANAVQVGSDPTSVDAKIDANYYKDMFTTFTTSGFLIDTSMVGELWLRARAQCNHVPYNQMDPTGNLSQGEVEDYKITVERAPVPEPATMLLFGSGLVSLAAVSRRKRN